MAIDVLPELQELVGAMIFASPEPVTAEQMAKTLVQEGRERGGSAAGFVEVTTEQIAAAIAELQKVLVEKKAGFALVEVGGGYRLESLPSCGAWIRRLLERTKKVRLSQSALETLAVIAYRQPCSRAEIEAVRGVGVDPVLRSLLDMQLIKVVGRSELPGRPFLFGTTQLFLTHFGLRSLEELPAGMELRGLKEGGGTENEPGAVTVKN